MKETAFAVKLRDKHGLHFMQSKASHLAPTGEPYVVLSGLGREDEAEQAFTDYVNTRAQGVSLLYWRVMPEFRESPPTFYMRVLVA